MGRANSSEETTDQIMSILNYCFLSPRSHAPPIASDPRASHRTTSEGLANAFRGKGPDRKPGAAETVWVNLIGNEVVEDARRLRRATGATLVEAGRGDQIILNLKAVQSKACK